jgi:sortase A
MKAIVAWLAQFLEWSLLGIAVGCLGFYAYESVEARRFQAEQTAAFERAARTEAAPVRIRAGGLVGMLDVPRLKLSTPVIEGDDDGTLKRAVGHRDGLFRPLKNVKVGDEIRFRTTGDEFVYRVTGTSIVMPDDLSVLAPQSGATLTLITCYPFSYVGPAPKRFIVHAERLASPTLTPSE